MFKLSIVGLKSWNSTINGKLWTTIHIKIWRFYMTPIQPNILGCLFLMSVQLFCWYLLWVLKECPRWVYLWQLQPKGVEIRRGVLTIPPDDVTDMQTITIAISWESPVMVNSEIFHIIYSYVIMCINKLEDRIRIYKLYKLFHHVNIQL